jgi:RNA-dependent RNA polymerase
VLAEDPNGLIGAKGNGEESGGKVVFPIRIRLGTKKDKSKKERTNVDKDGFAWNIAVDRPELSSSDGFRREAGSAAFIRARCDSQLAYHPRLREILRRPFVLAGRVYRAFRRKDSSVFLVEVDEVLRGYARPPPRYGRYRVPRSFFAFVDAHNPRALNGKQVRV